MDMRCSTWIWHRLDREELIAATRISHCGAVTLEVSVVRLIGPAIPDIMIAAVRIALPNLDPRSRNRASVQVENAAGNPRDAALSRPLVPGDVDQIIVNILRKTQRVERPGCLPGGRRQHSCSAGYRSAQPRCSRES